MHRKLRTALVIAGLTLPASLAAAQISANTPTGEGDPNAITCRAPQALPGQRLLGPQVCKTNAIWAQYHKDGMDVAADGIHDMPSEKMRSTHPMSCRPATAGGGGTTTMGSMTVGTICE
jgi:hypothetical protein